MPLHYFLHKFLICRLNHLSFEFELLELEPPKVPHFPLQLDSKWMLSQPFKAQEQTSACSKELSQDCLSPTSLFASIAFSQVSFFSHRRYLSLWPPNLDFARLLWPFSSFERLSSLAWHLLQSCAVLSRGDTFTVSSLHFRRHFQQVMAVRYSMWAHLSMMHWICSVAYNYLTCD